jgi:hypothetical protein
MSSVTPDQILMEGSKQRPLVVPSWVAAQLSDVWQGIKKNLEDSVLNKKNLEESIIKKKKSKQDRVRTSQVMPASAHNPT